MRSGCGRRGRWRTGRRIRPKFPRRRPGVGVDQLKQLTRYHTPAAVSAEPENPPRNTLGLHRVMFADDEIHDTAARLRAHGAELLGQVAQYESIYLLCYLRGPAGIIVAPAEQIG